MENSITGSVKKIPFFKKPGSITGTVLLALGGGWFLWNINPILTWLNSLLSNTLTAMGLIAALCAIVYCVFDPKVRHIVSELYFMLVRKTMGIVVDMDPISIVRHHIERMQNKIAEAEKNKGALKGLIKESERHRDEKRKQLDTDIIKLRKLTELAAQGSVKAAQEAPVYEHSVTRLTGVVERADARIEEARKWYKILDELVFTARLAVQDMEGEVNERVEEWNIIKKQHKVFTSVMGILSKDDRVGAFTMAMDNMSYDITQKLGEMENIIDETGSIISSYALDNAVASEKARLLLSKYEAGGIEALFSRNSPEKEPVYVEAVEVKKEPKQISWFD